MKAKLLVVINEGKFMQKLSSKVFFFIICMCCFVVTAKLLFLLQILKESHWQKTLTAKQLIANNYIELPFNTKKTDKRHSFANSSKSNIHNKNEDILTHKSNVIGFSNRELNETEFMIRMEKRMKERRELVKKTCQKVGLWNQKPLKGKYAVSLTHKLIHCFIPKTGCTNWKKVILMLNGHSENSVKQMNHDELHTLVANKYRIESIGLPLRAKTFIKFLAVRNPLDRLVSSYNDKFGLQPNGDFPQFAKTSVNMHKRYSQRKYEHYLATFDEFIGYISMLNRSKNYGVIANHWSTYNRICQPCSIHYDVIGHLDTIEEDSRYLLKLINAPKNVKYPSGYGKTGLSLTDKDSVLREFLSMDSQTLKTFYNVYKIDFEMFGYKPPSKFL